MCHINNECIEFQKQHFEKQQKVAIFKSLSQPFGSMYFNETWQIILVDLFCYQEMNKSGRF